MSRNPASFTILILISLLAAGSTVARGASVAQLLASAQPGAAVTLPEGTYHVDGDKVPAGVTLRGAGYRKTILDATGSVAGLVIGAGTGTTVSGLTVQGASGSAIAADSASHLMLSDIRILDSGIGVKLNSISSSRVENVVSARNKIGFVLSKSADTAIVNCTAAANSVTSISVSGDTHCAIFNCAFIGAPTGIALADNNSACLIDYNFYVANFTGKFGVQPARRSVLSWSQDAGVDAHSATHAVDFSDPSSGIYSPITPVDWHPTVAVTSGWGVAAFGGFAAPNVDTEGKQRKESWDAGAYQVSFPATRPPDGHFTVVSPDGVKSAGLYSADGRQIRPLFNNQPLPKGEYPFWLPSRTVNGDTIPAGKYEVRVAESNLSLSYIAMTGNGGESNERMQAASLGPERALFDATSHIVLAQTGVENAQYIRSFAPGLGHARWAVPGGGDCRGLTLGTRNRVWALSEMASDGTARLIAADNDTGSLLPIDGDKYNKTISGVFSPDIDGMTSLGAKLYVADPTKNAIYVAPENDLASWTSLKIPAPSSPAADSAHDLLWLVSKGVVVAVDPATGLVKYKVVVPGAPSSISVNGNFLAVTSVAARQVYVVDITTPGSARVIRTIGTGGAPYGPLRPDRLITPANVAVSADGSVLVVDYFRVSLFNSSGAVVASEMGNWGQRITLARFAGDSRLHVFNLGCEYTFAIDPKTRTWQPDMLYKVPAGLVADGQFPYGFYIRGGKNYGVFPGTIAKKPAVTIAQIDGGGMRPLLAYSFDDKLATIVVRRDSNSDGVIDENDTATPIYDAAGKPLPNLVSQVNGLTDDGALMGLDSSDPGAFAMTIPLKSASSNEYDWANRAVITASAGATGSSMVSPYDFKTVESFKPNAYVETPEGYVGGLLLKSGGGAGFSGGSTDLVGLDKTGKERWFYPINPPPAGRGIGVRALRSVADIVIVNNTTEEEFNAVDKDGLGLGLMGPPPAQHWLGMWVDGDAQVRTFVDDAGQPYVLVGDYATQAVHWMALNGTGQIRRTSIPVTISDTAAATLAALPAQPLAPLPLASMPVPSVLIKHLAAPLTIDGDPKKWRTAGVDPQIVITPDAGTGFNGPADCSAVIRMAYEGNNLYVQAIQFTKVATFHQMLSAAYKADAIEMEMNGFFSGYKYTIARTTDKGDVIYREQFLIPSATLQLDPAKAPLSIKVWDDATAFPERKIFEDIYGVDMAKTKVIVTEYKLPMDYAYGTKLPFKMQPGGGTFWLGFFVDDNAAPGTDLQRFLPWPATFLVFLNPDQGALASFE